MAKAATPTAPEPPVDLPPPGASFPVDPAPLGQRATTVIDEGPFAGQQARVDQIIAWPLYVLAHARYVAYQEAKEPGDELTALRELCDLYVTWARPVWSLEDLRGPIPPDAREMQLRVPVALIQVLYVLWLETFPQEATDGGE